MFLLFPFDSVYTVGFGSIFMNRTPINIFGFEPTPTTVALTISSLRQNHLSNAYLFPYALTDSAKLGDTVTFVTNRLNKGHNHLDGDQSWAGWHDDAVTIQVDAVTLDLITEILRDSFPAMYDSWSNALWLKMDTEGLEPTITRGGRQSLFSNSEIDPCFIKTEFKEHKEDSVNLLMASGYDMVDFEWNSISQNKRYSKEDAIQTDGDVFFAKKDALECVRRKVDKFQTLNKKRPPMESNIVEAKTDGSFGSIWVIVMVVLVVGWVVYYGWNKRHRYYPNRWRPHRH